MIKKAPIIMAYQVNLYCDNCGQLMKFGKEAINDDKGDVNLLYVCDCGHKEYTKNQYPHQIFHLDLSKEEVIG